MAVSGPQGEAGLGGLIIVTQGLRQRDTSTEAAGTVPEAEKGKRDRPQAASETFRQKGCTPFCCRPECPVKRVETNHVLREDDRKGPTRRQSVHAKYSPSLLAPPIAVFIPSSPLSI